MTSGLMQLAMIFVYFANNAWNTMLSITAVMILPPYLASTAYLWKLCWKKQNNIAGRSSIFPLVCGIAGTLYALWMIYAAGLNYLAMAFWFMALGIIIYCKARHENIKVDRKSNISECYFSTPELISVVLIIAVALAALVYRTDENKQVQKVFHKWSQQISEVTF